MPANLTPEYLEAEQRFKQAKTTPEKITALEEMLATIPKHKGTEKMQAELKRKLSRLRGEKQKKGGPKQAPPVHYVEPEGAGQVALVGPPNSGKSSLVARLTRATPPVADYPFTTRLPLPGMMPFENIQIQLVDLPPLHPDFPEPWLPQAIRNADAVALVVDLGDAAVLEQLTDTLAQLEQGKISVGPKADPLPRGCAHKPALLVGNKSDQPRAGENFEILAELWKDRFRLLAVSAATGENLENFRRALFDLLGIVRVYTKIPGKKATLDAPFVLPRGATVRDVAERVHKDFLARLKFARLWGAGKFDGQMVQRDYILEDNDVIELHG
ncbi:MAG: GTPase [Terriglobia bacterium]